MAVQYVFSFGCPRSGTTLFRKWLESGTGYLSVKIPEGSAMHPIQRDDGLYDLFFMFDRKLSPTRLTLFVRSIRSVTGIFKSFYTARYVAETRHTDGKGCCNLDGFVNVSDEKIFQFIRNERRSVRFQKLQYAECLNLIEVDYDRLQCNEYQTEIVTTIAKSLPEPDKNYERLLKWITKHFNKIPVREGALSHKLDVELPAELKLRIAKFETDCPL